MTACQWKKQIQRSLLTHVQLALKGKFIVAINFNKVMLYDNYHLSRSNSRIGVKETLTDPAEHFGLIGVKRQVV